MEEVIKGSNPGCAGGLDEVDGVYAVGLYSLCLPLRFLLPRVALPNVAIRLGFLSSSQLLLSITNQSLTVRPPISCPILPLIPGFLCVYVYVCIIISWRLEMLDPTVSS